MPCRDCPQRYIGQTSKKIATRITEDKNDTILDHYLEHTCMTTVIPLTGLTKHTCKFKEAWYSTDSNTIS